jgi:dUTP pyrophosphatase
MQDPPTKKQKMASLILKVKKLSEFATLPVRGSAKAAGYDLVAAHPTVIPAKGKELIKTDISIAVPSGHYGRIAPRSGLAWKNFIDVGAGVIDEDYRGAVGVLLFNFSDTGFQGASVFTKKNSR